MVGNLLHIHAVSMVRCSFGQKYLEELLRQVILQFSVAFDHIEQYMSFDGVWVDWRFTRKFYSHGITGILQMAGRTRKYTKLCFKYFILFY